MEGRMRPTIEMWLRLEIDILDETKGLPLAILSFEWR
jgi:hypothetical protein